MNKLTGYQNYDPYRIPLFAFQQADRQQKLHILHVLNAKPILNTQILPKKHVNYNNNFYHRFQLQLFKEYNEVPYSFEKVKNMKKGRIDTKIPFSFKMYVPRRPGFEKDHKQINHQQNISSLIKRMDNLNKSYNKKFDQVRNPFKYLSQIKYINAATTINQSFFNLNSSQINKQIILNRSNFPFKNQKIRKIQSAKITNSTINSLNSFPYKVLSHEDKEVVVTKNNYGNELSILKSQLKKQNIYNEIINEIQILKEDELIKYLYIPPHEFFNEKCYIKLKKQLIQLFIKYNIVKEKIIHKVKELIQIINPQIDQSILADIFQTIQIYIIQY